MKINGWNIYAFLLRAVLLIGWPIHLLYKLVVKEKIVAVCSQGGHLADLLDSFSDTLHKEVVYLVPNQGVVQGTSLGKSKHHIIDPGRSPAKLVKNALTSILYILRFRPKVIVSSGSGVAFASLLLGKFLGAKIIFLECACQVKKPSVTGFLAAPLADLHIVQSPHLLKFFPKAQVGTLL